MKNENKNVLVNVNEAELGSEKENLEEFEGFTEPFEVRVECGDVFINGKFYRQLCFSAEAVGSAIAAYLDGIPADK